MSDTKDTLNAVADRVGNLAAELDFLDRILDDLDFEDGDFVEILVDIEDEVEIGARLFFGLMLAVTATGAAFVGFLAGRLAS